MAETVYTVEISGCDWFESPLNGEGYWGEEHYVCDVFEFDTYEEASKFALNMEPNDVIAYEKGERCNSLDVCIYKRVHSGPCEEWKLEGELAWVGNNIVDKCL